MGVKTRLGECELALFGEELNMKWERCQYGWMDLGRIFYIAHIQKVREALQETRHTSCSSWNRWNLPEMKGNTWHFGRNTTPNPWVTKWYFSRSRAFGKWGTEDSGLFRWNSCMVGIIMVPQRARCAVGGVHSKFSNRCRFALCYSNNEMHAQRHWLTSFHCLSPEDLNMEGHWWMANSCATK